MDGQARAESGAGILFSAVAVPAASSEARSQQQVELAAGTLPLIRCPTSISPSCSAGSFAVPDAYRRAPLVARQSSHVSRPVSAAISSSVAGRP